MEMQEKFRALTLLEKGDPVIAAARDFGISREAIYQFERLVASLPSWMVQKRK